MAPPNRPGAQGPLQAGDPSPVVLPKRPWGQLMQEAEPESAYFPTVHSCVVGDVELSGHAYPAEQLPEQADVDSAVALPKVPPGHTKQVARPAPNDPAGQGKHAARPPVEYCPAVQGPVHAAVVKPHVTP